MEPLYVKWVKSPTVTTIEETNFPIWNINFPAVTICSNNKVVKQQFELVLKTAPWNASAEKWSDSPNKNDINYTKSNFENGVQDILRKFAFFVENQKIADRPFTKMETFAWTITSPTSLLSCNG